MNEFMANMNRGADGAGAGGARTGGDGTGSDRTGGAGAGGAEAGGAGADGAGIGGAEMVAAEIYREKDKVKFTTATLQGHALTWWNGRTASMGIDAANGTLWTEVKQWMTKEFCPRSVVVSLKILSRT
ncbi:hypothetical protein Tco_0029796 [Tanacetum coccineum]